MRDFGRTIYIDGAALCVREGASLTRIDLEACFRRFERDFHDAARRKSAWKCVGTRDITTGTYIFWTQPPFALSFARAGLFGLRRSGAFRELQEQLNRCGYTTYDLS